MLIVAVASESTRALSVILCFAVCPNLSVHRCWYILQRSTSEIFKFQLFRVPSLELYPSSTQLNRSSPTKNDPFPPPFSSSPPFECSRSSFLPSYHPDSPLPLPTFFTFVSSFYPSLLSLFPSLSRSLSLFSHDLFSSSSQRRHLGLSTRATEGMTTLLGKKGKRMEDARGE